MHLLEASQVDPPLRPIDSFRHRMQHWPKSMQLQQQCWHPLPWLIEQVQEVDFLKALEMIGDGKIQDAKSIAGLFMASAWSKACR